MPFPKDDLSVLFGNLLENALNAAEKERDAKVTVSAKYEKGFLFFNVRNTFTKPHSSNDESSSHSDSLIGPHHGIGLHSVRHIVDSNKGKFHVKHEDGIFTCSVLIPLEA